MTSALMPCCFANSFYRLEHPVQRCADREDRYVGSFEILTSGSPIVDLVVAPSGTPPSWNMLADVVDPLALQVDHRIGAVQRRSS